MPKKRPGEKSGLPESPRESPDLHTGFELYVPEDAAERLLVAGERIRGSLVAVLGGRSQEREEGSGYTEQMRAELESKRKRLEALVKLEETVWNELKQWIPLQVAQGANDLPAEALRTALLEFIDKIVEREGFELTQTEMYFLRAHIAYQLNPDRSREPFQDDEPSDEKQ